MHDAFMVGGLERVGGLDRHAEHVLERERAVPEPLGQRLPVQVLHDEKVGALVLPDVVEHTDVGMRQRGDGLRLALEAAPAIRVGGVRGAQELDGDDAVQAGVARLVHLAHAARADRRQNLIRPEPRPHRETGRQLIGAGSPVAFSRVQVAA
jgi:hypothetical protein